MFAEDLFHPSGPASCIKCKILSSLLDQLQAQGEAASFEVLAPINVQLELVHCPLLKVALEGALPHVAYKQMELHAFAAHGIAHLDAHGAVRRAFRDPALGSAACSLALRIPSACCPALARREVKAHIREVPKL